MTNTNLTELVIRAIETSFAPQMWLENNNPSDFLKVNELEEDYSIEDAEIAFDEAQDILENQQQKPQEITTMTNYEIDTMQVVELNSENMPTDYQEKQWLNSNITNNFDAVWDFDQQHDGLLMTTGGYGMMKHEMPELIEDATEVYCIGTYNHRELLSAYDYWSKVADVTWADANETYYCFYDMDDLNEATKFFDNAESIWEAKVSDIGEAFYIEFNQTSFDSPSDLEWLSVAEAELPEHIHLILDKDADDFEFDVQHYIEINLAK